MVCVNGSISAAATISKFSTDQVFALFNNIRSISVDQSITQFKFKSKIFISLSLTLSIYLSIYLYLYLCLYVCDRKSVCVSDQKCVVCKWL